MRQGTRGSLLPSHLCLHNHKVYRPSAVSVVPCCCYPGSQSGSTAYDVMIGNCGVMSPATAPSQAATAALGRSGSRAAEAVPAKPQSFALASRFWGAAQRRRWFPSITGTLCNVNVVHGQQCLEAVMNISLCFAPCPVGWLRGAGVLNLQPA